ncbi:hypothetical protein CF392_12860 [Tamilnaduibacter salinus]|uniref:PrcB C-terminal domain-containing protein n=1 Tax=Tamilnaduibacter salinus TaxID=1484056 RepID=A0A2A2I038_9GAMM|nr:protease complex subunit PrcB family protein [Tamilnaduibacter salinus]PAV25069.1 hypothetical protein CF392_12860 [Tamilnaduibacter salinus]
MIRIRWFAGLLASAALTGCAAIGSSGPVVTASLSSSHCGFTAEGLTLVSSESDWQQLQQDRVGALPPWPARDDRSMLVISMGERPTGGYSIEMRDARIRDELLVIDVLVERPGDGMVSQALTTPCAILNVPSEGWDEVVVKDKTDNLFYQKL